MLMTSLIISNTEGDWQKAAYKLNKIIVEHGLPISVDKTKLIVFKEREPVGHKIIIGNKIIEQVNSFNCLGNLISYEEKWTLVTN
jgi:hypothetical protein